MFDFIPDLLARQLTSVMRESNWDRAEGQTRPHADPQNQGAAFRSSFGFPSHLVFGTIVDYTSLAYAYKVQVDRAHGPVVAYFTTHTSLGAFGAREINLLRPGSNVWMLLNEQGRFGWILSVVPGFMVDGRRGLLDQLSQTTRARVDGSHRTPLKMQKKQGGHIADRIAGRPFDAVQGDVGWINSRGGKISIDDELVQLAVDEACGVFAFYRDQLLRIAGYNLEMFGAGFERQSFNDVDELRDYEGYALYPYEQLGLFAPGDPRRELAAKAFQIDEPWYANWEPKDDRQQPFHRLQQFRGYLGQGSRETLAAPPKSAPTLNLFGTEVKLLGVHQDLVAASGHRSIGTSHGVSIVKRLLNVVPHRLVKPEDGRGDKVDNYKFSGQTGSGADHKIAGEPEAAGQYANLQRAAGVLDMHAYVFNWSGLHPFHYHKKDWYTPQESELGLGPGMVVPSFGKLANTALLSAPSPVSIKIDDRHSAQCFPNFSNFDLLPDGGIVIGDGYGSEIRLSGGHATISAPGDVYLKSGRNVNTFAGWDAIVRAQNSFDITATTHDGRIKAQKHLHFFGGAEDAAGSILFECRSKAGTFDFAKAGEEVKSSGIVFRAKDADFVVATKNVYVRSDGGAITIDADKGKGSLVFIGNTVRTHAGAEIINAFGTDGNVTVAHKLTTDGAVLSGYFYTTGTIMSGDNILAGANLLAAGGHVLTSEGISVQLVGPLKDQALDAASAQLELYATQARRENPQLAKQQYQTNPQQLYYADKKPGNAELLTQLQFSFRTEKQYLTEDWILPEDRWQQWARLSGGSNVFWEEKSVKTVNAGETYPYPGRSNHEGEKLLTQDLNLVTLTTGFSQDRGELYETPQLATPTPQKLADGYRIIKRAP